MRDRHEPLQTVPANVLPPDPILARPDVDPPQGEPGVTPAGGEESRRGQYERGMVAPVDAQQLQGKGKTVQSPRIPAQPTSLM